MAFATMPKVSIHDEPSDNTNQQNDSVSGQRSPRPDNCHHLLGHEWKQA